MKKAIIYFLAIIFSEYSFSGFAQHEAATKFFSSVPQLISGYPNPGDPCKNAVEFIINTNEKNTISLKEANITKNPKAKAKVNVTGTGNETVWYKLVFNTDCELTFRIYSDRAEDTYHYFVYRQNEDPGFCGKLSEKSVVPIRANMLGHKEGIIGTGITGGIKINYRDTTDFYFKRILYHTPFLDGISGKAGETYYINIYHMEGADAFHYLVLSACYREINLKTENENVNGEKAQIIEKLPEHVTKPPAEKIQAEKDSLAAIEKGKEEKKKAEAEAKKKEEEKKKTEAEAKQKAEAKSKAETEAKKKAEKEAAEKAKAAAAQKAKTEAAEKKIAEAKARQKAAEAAKNKSAVKKISPQLVQFDEQDTLKQYLIEGEIIYSTDPRGPVVQGEVYLSNADGSVTVLKKMYTNEKGMFRFANLPKEHNYLLSLNSTDPNLTPGNKPELKGKLSLNGQPAEGILINSTVKTGADGSFTLSGKELFSLTVNDLFNRWSIDLSKPEVYSDILKRYGSVELEGLVYRVQIGAYRDEENFNYAFVSDLGKVEKQSLPDGITRFVMGEFRTLKEAEDFKQKVLSRKINDAFILAYFKGDKKFLEELLEKKLLGED